jgi:hypothetical protein
MDLEKIANCGIRGNCAKKSLHSKSSMSLLQTKLNWVITLQKNAFV